MNLLGTYIERHVVVHPYEMKPLVTYSFIYQMFAGDEPLRFIATLEEYYHTKHHCRAQFWVVYKDGVKRDRADLFVNAIRDVRVHMEVN